MNAVILSFFVFIIGSSYCESYVLVGINGLVKEAQHGIDLEIFKQIDRFYSIFRKAEPWKTYGEIKVKSEFSFFVEDDNVPELKNYLKFFATLGPFFDDPTICFSILYTKYIAMFHALHLLNLYKNLTNKLKDSTETVDIADSKIADIYLQISQYFLWYARTGTQIIQEVTYKKLSKSTECAKFPYEVFKKAFEVLFDKMYETYFTDVRKTTTDNGARGDYKKFWEEVFDKFSPQINVINKYFSAVLTGSLVEKIDKSDFVNEIAMETFLENFISDLVVIKGRDYDETFFNFDNDYVKKDMFKTNIINVMRIIKIRKHNTDSSETALKNKEKSEINDNFIILTPYRSQEYTCLKFKLDIHDVIDLRTYNVAKLPERRLSSLPAGEDDVTPILGGAQ